MLLPPGLIESRDVDFIILRQLLQQFVGVEHKWGQGCFGIWTRLWSIQINEDERVSMLFKVNEKAGCLERATLFAALDLDAEDTFEALHSTRRGVLRQRTGLQIHRGRAGRPRSALAVVMRCKQHVVARQIHHRLGQMPDDCSARPTLLEPRFSSAIMSLPHLGSNGATCNFVDSHLKGFYSG